MSMSPPPPPPGPGPQDQPGEPFRAPYQPSYGGGYGVREHPQGTTILVLGILSLVVCGILGPIAWVMGNNALREIDADPGAYTNRGMVQGGRICGIIASVILAVTVVAVIVLVAAGAASSASR